MNDETIEQPCERVAILQKGNIFAAISLFIGRELYALARHDPRTSPLNTYSSHTSAESARNAFHSSVANSRDRGWTVLYNGRPMKG